MIIALIIFTAILQEIIAVISLIGLFKGLKSLFKTALIMLSIIWFGSHFKLMDLVLVNVLPGGSTVAAHVILFVICVIGLSIEHFNQVNYKVNRFKLFGRNQSQVSTTTNP